MEASEQSHRSLYKTRYGGIAARGPVHRND